MISISARRAQRSLLLNPFVSTLTLFEDAGKSSVITSPIKKVRPMSLSDAISTSMPTRIRNSCVAEQPAASRLLTCGNRSSVWPASCNSSTSAVWALQLDNGPPWALLDLACTRADIVLHSGAPLLQSGPAVWLLEAAAPMRWWAHIIRGVRLAEPLSPITGELPLWRHIPSTHRPAPPAAPPRSTQPPVTTGQPKGVCPSLTQMMALVYALGRASRASQGGKTTDPVAAGDPAY